MPYCRSRCGETWSPISSFGAHVAQAAPPRRAPRRRWRAWRRGAGGCARDGCRAGPRAGSSRACAPAPARATARSPLDSTMCSPPPAVSVKTRICQAPPYSEVDGVAPPSRAPGCRGGGGRRSDPRWCRSSSPWRWAMATRSGSRAMVPSSFMISQITPEGFSPASRAMSTAASVWPARTSTPPSRARSGKTCPGVAMSCGPERGSIATATVRARSCAEMPVVTPSRASIETVKAVSCREEFDAAISGSPSASSRSPGSARQISPRPCVAMKLIGVRRAHLRRDHQVALVLAVLVVDQDEHPAVARVLDDLLDRGDRVEESDWVGLAIASRPLRRAQIPQPLPEGQTPQAPAAGEVALGRKIAAEAGRRAPVALGRRCRRSA